MNIRSDLGTIGKRIRSIRVGKGMSQETLALEARVSQSSISNMELGKHAPIVVRFLLVVDALGCPLGDILEPPVALVHQEEPITVA